MNITYMIFIYYMIRHCHLPTNSKLWTWPPLNVHLLPSPYLHSQIFHFLLQLQRFGYGVPKMAAKRQSSLRGTLPSPHSHSSQPLASTFISSLLQARSFRVSTGFSSSFNASSFLFRPICRPSSSSSSHFVYRRSRPSR